MKPSYCLRHSSFLIAALVINKIWEECLKIEEREMEDENCVFKISGIELIIVSKTFFVSKQICINK